MRPCSWRATRSEFMNGAVLVIDAGKETLSDRAAKFYPMEA